MKDSLPAGEEQTGQCYLGVTRQKTPSPPALIGSHFVWVRFLPCRKKFPVPTVTFSNLQNRDDWSSGSLPASQGETAGLAQSTLGVNPCLLHLGNDGSPVFEPLPAMVKKYFMSFNFPSSCYKSVIFIELFPGFLPGVGDLERRRGRQFALGHAQGTPARALLCLAISQLRTGSQYLASAFWI